MSVVLRTADETDPGNVLAAKNGGSGRLVALLRVGRRDNWEVLNNKKEWVPSWGPAKTYTDTIWGRTGFDRIGEV